MRRTRTGFQLPDFGLGGGGRDDAREMEEHEEPRPSRRAPARRSSGGYQRQTMTEAVLNQVGRTAASTITSAVLRGILGSLKRGR